VAAAWTGFEGYAATAANIDAALPDTDRQIDRQTKFVTKPQ
jgi:hypothetical protein